MSTTDKQSGLTDDATMETINNVAAAATKTLFGDGTDNKEPVSGRKGDVTKGEPYDAGNLDPEDQKRFENLATPGADSIATPGIEKNLDNAATTNTTDVSKNETIGANPTLNETKTSDVKTTDDPTAAATTSSEPTPKGDTSLGQTDPKEKPTNTTENPEDVTVEPKGPGPKPVATLAKEHGGDAGQANNTPATAVDTDKKEGGEVKDDKKNEGTGEQVVHASGLAADGGDFDASKPGAGVEADRLLNEKGISTSGGSGGSDSKGGSSTPGKKDKPSLTDRIKAKFHKK